MHINWPERRKDVNKIIKRSRMRPDWVRKQHLIYKSNSVDTLHWALFGSQI
jgi:hypothetical protein